MQTKTIPFNLETAKKIQAGEIKGRIKTERGENVRIICWNRKNEHHTPIVALIDNIQKEELYFYSEAGEYDFGSFPMLNLVLEVSDNELQFKPFDKVLVRIKPEYTDNNAESDYWCPAIFQNYSYTDAFKDMPYHAGGHYWNECIPYEGNEHLLGTTDNQNED